MCDLLCFYYFLFVVIGTRVAVTHDHYLYDSRRPHLICKVSLI